METKSNEATLQRPEGDRVLDAPMVEIDLVSFIQQIREEPSWKDSDRNSITIFKTDGLRIVLTALHKGAEMIRNSIDGIISVQVLEGVVALTTDQQSIELGKGKMVALHENIYHSVLAKQEAIILLTLTSA